LATTQPKQQQGQSVVSGESRTLFDPIQQTRAHCQPNPFL